MIRIEWTYSEGLSRKDLPLEPAELRRLLAIMEKGLKTSPEWIEAKRILRSAPACVSARLCGDEDMRELQNRFRRLDRTTDVLSFPSIELDGGSPEPGFLGDLVVSLDTVARAAKTARRPVAQEFAEVFLHGVLHLLGFDHIGNSTVAKAKAQRMKGLQAEFFKAWKRAK